MKIQTKLSQYELSGYFQRTKLPQNKVLTLCDRIFATGLWHVPPGNSDEFNISRASVCRVKEAN